MIAPMDHRLVRRIGFSVDRIIDIVSPTQLFLKMTQPLARSG